jgi:hypothetical protein
MMQDKITSLTEFRSELDKAVEQLLELMQAIPSYYVFESIAKQLAWLREVSVNKDPRTIDKKSTLNFGLLAARELDDSDVKGVRQLARRLHDLSYFLDG